MTTSQENVSNASPKGETSTTSQPRRRRRRALWLLLAVPVAAAAGFGVLKAHAEAAGFGYGFGGGGFAGDNPEAHRMFMQRRLERGLDLVKATDSQRTAIKSIFARMVTELQPVHQEHRRLHEAIAAAFAAPTLDRAGIESLRQQAAKLMDQGSQILSKGLLDAAEVLDAQQRQTLVQHLQEMHGRRHRG
jgi:Spy/CpxP family protein refolding chaperone